MYKMNFQRWFPICSPVLEGWSTKDYRNSQKQYRPQTVTTLASELNSQGDRQQTERQLDTAEQQPKSSISKSQHLALLTSHCTPQIHDVWRQRVQETCWAKNCQKCCHFIL